MRNPPARKAFVASTRKDLAGHREHVIRALRDAGLHVDPMENWTADPETPLRLSTERVRSCDLCVLLVGHHIGHVPKGEARSITQQEYDAAMLAGLDVLVFVQDLDGRPDGKRGDERSRIHRWRAHLTERHTVGSFDSEPDSVPIASALSRWLRKDVSDERLAVRLPEAPNPNFMGRDGLLADIREEVAQSDATPLVHVLSGLGGVGKSEIAVQYAHRYAERYSVVWWIRAEAASTAQEDLAALASALGLAHDEGSDIERLAELARLWLEGHSGWLIVLDNASGLSGVRHVLPSTGGGHVLLTSRDAAWGRIGIVHEVEPLSREDAIAFLQGAGSGEDEGVAARLADELGDLPLALEQTRGLVEATGISLDRYLELFERNRAGMLQERLDDGPYPHSVATTWSLAIDRLSEESPRALAILDAVALLAPDPVPLHLFAAPGVDGYGEDRDAMTESRVAGSLKLDALDLLKAQAAIKRYALARVSDDTITMHRLVQVVVRDRLDERRRRELLGGLIARMLALLSETDGGTSDRITWRAHVSALLDVARSDGLSGRDVSDLLVEHGRILKALGRYADARDEFDAALAGRPAVEHPDRATLGVLLDRAHMSAVLDDRDDAIAEIERIQEMMEGMIAGSPRDAMTGLRAVSLAYRDLEAFGRYREAAVRALAVARDALDDTDLEITEYLYEAASASHNARDPDDEEALNVAKALHEEAIAVGRRLTSDRDPSIAPNLGCLGDVLSDLGEVDQAIELRKEALSIVEEHEGPQSLEAASALCHLSRMYILAGRHEEGLAAARNAVRSREWAGPRHPEDAWAHLCLSHALRSRYHSRELSAEDARGALTEAVHAARIGLTILEGAFGVGHARLVPALDALTWSLVDLEEWHEARTEALRTIEIANRNPHVHASFLVQAHHAIAWTWMAEDQVEATIEALESTIEVAERHGHQLDLVEAWSAVVGSLLGRLAWAALEAGRVSEAVAHAERAVERLEVAKHPDRPRALVTLGRILFTTGEIEGAQRVVGRIDSLLAASPEPAPEVRAEVEHFRRDLGA